MLERVDICSELDGKEVVIGASSETKVGIILYTGIKVENMAYIYYGESLV